MSQLFIEKMNQNILFNSTESFIDLMINTSIDTNQTKLDQRQQSTASIVVQIIAYTTILIACIIGNSAVLLTLTFNKKLKTVTNCFLINLAISDILLGKFSNHLYSSIKCLIISN